MRKFTLSTIAVLAMSSMVMAGGVVEPVAEVAPVPVVDESGIYIGLGFTHVNTTIEGDYNEYQPNMNGRDPYTTSFEADVSSSMTTLLAGYQINKYFAVEGRYIPQYIDFEISEPTDVEASLSMSNMALYAKGMYPMGDFTLYGLLGYGQTSAEIEIMGSSPEPLDRSDTGLQWGIGASYALNESTSLFVDYTQLYSDSDFDGVIDDINDYLLTNPDQWVDNTDISIYAITFGMTYKF